MGGYKWHQQNNSFFVLRVQENCQTFFVKKYRTNIYIPTYNRYAPIPRIPYIS